YSAVNSSATVSPSWSVVLFGPPVLPALSALPGERLPAGGDRLPGLLGDQVGVDLGAGSQARRGGRGDLGRQLGDVARRPHPGDVGAPGRVGGDVLADPR